MINIGELRVGNIVLYTEDNDELPVLKIDGDKRTLCLDLLLGLNIELNEQDIDPLPLTPEWLLRCGFKDDGGNMWSGPEIENDDSIEYFTIKKKNAGFFFYGSEWTHGKPFLYVHQLQNLYFAMTGEELTIKP
jgi:hypothetical protein